MMRRYRDVVLQVLGQLVHYEISQVPQEHNANAKMLNKLSLGARTHLQDSLVRGPQEVKLEAYLVLPVQTRDTCWLDHLKEYRKTSTLPPNEAKVKLVKRHAQFTYSLATHSSRGPTTAPCYDIYIPMRQNQSLMKSMRAHARPTKEPTPWPEEQS